MITRTWLVWLAGIAVATPAAAYDQIEVKGGGTIAGTVSFLGAAPKAAPLEITKDQDFCGKNPLFNESLLVSESKGLRNVVVFLKGVKAGKALNPGSATLANVNCRYEPHVQALVVGTELKVENADPILHNTHIKLPKSDVFNYGLPVQGQVVTRKIVRKGLMKVGCDAGHTWMSGYIASFDHPYFAVTDEAGQFRIDAVPPGAYTLLFWHEKLGQKKQKVVVTADGQIDASMKFE